MSDHMPHCPGGKRCQDWPICGHDAKPVETCDHTILDRDGIEQPCEETATHWRWYQDVEHEDMLHPTCEVHSNEGGRRMHAAEAELARVNAGRALEQAALARALPIVTAADAALAALTQGGQSASVRAREALTILSDIHEGRA